MTRDSRMISGRVPRIVITFMRGFPPPPPGPALQLLPDQVELQQHSTISSTSSRRVLWEW